MSTTAIFLTGMNSAGLFVAGLFFFRFWARSKDIFFAAFGFAFWLFALNQAVVALSGIPRESQSWIYLLRLAGFVMIIAAILAKNLGGRVAR